MEDGFHCRFTVLHGALTKIALFCVGLAGGSENSNYPQKDCIKIIHKSRQHSLGQNIERKRYFKMQAILNKDSFIASIPH